MQFLRPSFDPINNQKYNIQNLINSVKGDRLSDTLKKDIVRALIAHGYYLLIDLHRNDKLDLFSDKLKPLLITSLIEMMNELRIGVNGPTMFSLTDFVYGLNELDETTRLRVIQKIRKADILNKVDKLVSVLREVYNINVPHENIVNAYSRYGRERIDSYHYRIYPSDRKEMLEDYIKDELEKI